MESIEPVAGFQFQSNDIIVSRAHQYEKFQALGLDERIHGEHVDPSFYIGIGIQVGIARGISAQGNVNLLSSIVQHKSVKLDEPLVANGLIKAVEPVPRGQAITTEVSFENGQGEQCIAAPRQSLRPDPSNKDARGAGNRPSPVVSDPSSMQVKWVHQLNAESVVAYTSEGNAIHYEMDAANRAGFRAPIIGGGIGVHYLVAALHELGLASHLNLDIYFRRPIFWDDEFAVAVSSDNAAVALIKDGKILTEARIN